MDAEDAQICQEAETVCDSTVPMGSEMVKAIQMKIKNQANTAVARQQASRRQWHACHSYQRKQGLLY